MPPLVLTLVGLVILVASAYLLVEGATRLAYALGVSELIVGLTIVAVGTSAPELMISIATGWQIRAGDLSQNAGSDLIIGNVIGSNIANIGLILGVAALIRLIRIDPALLKRDYLWMAGAAALVAVFALDARFAAWEGAILLVGMVAFSAQQYWAAQAQPTSPDAKRPASRLTLSSGLRYGGLILGGIIGLALGSNWLVSGATSIARDLGVNEFIIGLTLVALGTSLPELATSITASWRHEGDIVVGNIIGSNIYNLLLILAVGSLITPLSISDSTREVQIPLMLGLTLALYPLMRAQHSLSRWEGGLLLAAYAGIIGLGIALNA
jgi:cation:H+ antiporter